MNGRNESVEERLDRNWNELMQELRVMQTGAQILAAFLVVLPFQAGFASLGHPERTFYLVLLVFSALLIVRWSPRSRCTGISLASGSRSPSCTWATSSQRS